MILNSTFYKNPERTISGLSNFVSTADTIILCDTSLGIVYLNLLEIPNDQWNTTYKLYVVDKSNNAGTNAIAIFAPAGYTINNQSSLIIDTDGGAVVIRVASNTGYLGSLTSAGSGGSVSVVNAQNPLDAPVTLTTALDKLIVMGLLTTNAGNDVYLQNAFISLPIADITGLITSKLLIPNQWYNIQDAKYGYFNHKFNVYLPATTDSTLSTFGIGEFYDADYQDQGDYSGVSGYAGQLGIWTSSLAVVVKNVCIWNNLHYVNLTGVNTATDPASDIVNWQVLSYSNTNGYIVAYNQIIYGAKNQIVYRKDIYNNEVEYNDIVGLTSFDRFPFGNEKVQSNKVLSNSYWNFCNTIITEKVENNTLYHTELYWTTLAYVNNCVSNNFSGTIRPLDWRFGSTTLDIINNNFSICQGVSVLQECSVQNNNFNLSSIVLNLSGSSTFVNNNIVNSSISITKDHSTFSHNNLNQSNFILGGSDGTETENVLNNCQVNIANNSGFFQANNTNQGSSIQIGNISPTGLFNFNNLFSATQISVNDISSNFGDNGIKGIGNTFYNSTIEITQFLGEFAGNLISKVVMQINRYDGSINLCEFTGEGSMTIDDMNNRTIIGLVCKEFVYGSAGYTMPESYSNGVYQKGLASVSCTLDCNDPAIYDLATFTLTIPVELRSWGGVFTLSNANGKLIKKIIGTNNYAPITFFNDFGTTSFDIVNVAGAVAGTLISNVAPTTLNINYRLNGSDYIVTNSSGLLMAVTEINIFT